MSNKARRNYIKAISQQVDRKKMYKSHKQWVVAGMSFLVAMGLGAIATGSNTHASTTNNQDGSVQRTLSNKKQNQFNNQNNKSDDVQSQASTLHKQIIANNSNVTQSSVNKSTQLTNSNNNKLHTVSSTSKSILNNGIHNNQNKSMNTKNTSSSIKSNTTTLNLGTSTQQKHGWNFAQHGVNNNDFDNTDTNSENYNTTNSNVNSSNSLSVGNAHTNNVSISNVNLDNYSETNESLGNKNTNKANQVDNSKLNKNEKDSKPDVINISNDEVNLGNSNRQNKNNSDKIHAPKFDSNHIVASGNFSDDYDNSAGINSSAGNARWKLDNDGVFLIYGGTYSGSLTNMKNKHNNNSFMNFSKIKYLKFKDTILPNGFSFFSLPNVKIINLSGINQSTPNVDWNSTIIKERNNNNSGPWDMMFAGDPNLTTINFGHNLNTQNMTGNTGAFFMNDDSLKHLINFSDCNWNNLTDVNNFFLNDSSLSDLDLSNFDTYRAIANNHSGNGGNGLSNFIVGCTNLRHIKLGPKTILTSQAINGDPTKSNALNNGAPMQLADGTAHPGDWTLLQGVSAQAKWGKQSGSANVILTNNGDLYITNGSITDNRNDVQGNGWNSNMWNNVKHIYTSNVTAPTSMRNLFSRIIHLQSLDLSGLNTVNTTSMSDMNRDDKELTTVNLSGLNTSKVKDMSYLLASDYNLHNINGLSDLKTPKLVNMQSMFSDDQSLSSLDLSNMDTSHVRNMSRLFFQNIHLKTLNLSGKFNDQLAIQSDLRTNDASGWGVFQMFSQYPSPQNSINTLLLNSDTTLIPNTMFYSHNLINLNNNQTFFVGEWNSSVKDNILDNNKPHPGIWTNNAEIINLQHNGQTIKSELIKGNFNTASDIGDTLISIPSEYRLDDPEQRFTYSGGITNVSVHSISSDTVNNANDLINSDLSKTNDLASADAKDNTFAGKDIDTINNAKKTISGFANNINGYKTHITYSDAISAENDIQSANSAYDNAYSANADIESLMNNSLNSDNSKIASLFTDSTNASKAVASADGTIAKDVSSLSNDANNLNTLNGDKTSLSNAISSAQGTINNDSSAITAWKNSSSAISQSLASAIKSNGNNSTAISNLETQSTSNSKGLQNAISQLDTDATNFSNSIKNNSSVASNAMNWIKSNSASLSNASTKASEASASANDALTSLNNESTEINYIKQKSSSINSAITQANSNNSWIKNNSANVSAINRQITSINNQMSDDSKALNNAISSKASNTILTTDYSKLNGDIVTASSIAKQGSSIAANDSNWINNNSANLNNASANASKAESWIASNSANLSNASNKAKNASSSANTAISSLNNESNEIKYINQNSNAINSAIGQATSNSNWIHTNSASFSALSNAIKINNSDITKASSALQSDINKKANTSDLTRDSSALNSNIIKASQLASSANSLATSNSTVISTNTTSLSNAIKTLSNSANTNFNYAKNSLSTLNNLTSDNKSSLSTIVSSLSTHFSKDEQRLSTDENNINKINVNNISKDISNIQKDINNLKANSAITLTFINNGNQFHSPITLTNGYIKQNGKAVNGTTQGEDGTYDVSSLLNVSTPQGYHVNGNYIITVGKNSNGIANMTLNQPVPKTKTNVVEPLMMMVGDTNSSLESSNNPVDVIGNQAEYKGTITLNFGNGHKATINYDTGANNSNALTGDTINLLNYADNANTPNDYLSKNLISNFDTTGYNFAKNGSGDYSFTIQPSDATNQNGADVHTDNITLNFSANTVTDRIHYMYGNHQEGSDTTTGTDDAPANWDANNAKGLHAGWQLDNKNSNPFTITNNGITNINVVPIQQKDTINYVFNTNDKNYKGKTGTIATTYFSGNDSRATDAGNNSFIIGNNPNVLPKNYHIVNPNQSINYDGSSHSIEIAPNTETETINYMYNGQQKGSTTINGLYDTSSDWTNTNGLNTGWKLVNSSTPFIFTNKGTVNVAVTPIQQNDKIQYVFNTNDPNYRGKKGIIVSDNIDFKGNDSRTGVNGSFTIGSNPKGIPTNYHIVNPGAVINYDGQTHQIEIAPNGETETINYIYNSHKEGSTTLSSKYMYQGNENNGNGMNPNWHLVSGNNIFNFTPNGSINVNVAPNQVTDTINYVDGNKNSSKYEQVIGTQTFNGNINSGTVINDAGNTTFDINGNGDNIPTGYQLQSKNNELAYDGNTHTIYIIGTKHNSNNNPNDPSNPLSPKNPNNPSNSGNKNNPLNPNNPSSPTNPSNPNSPYNPSNKHHNDSKQNNNPWNPKSPNSPFNNGNHNNPYDPNGPLNPNHNGGNDDPNNPNSPLNPNNPNSPLNPKNNGGHNDANEPNNLWNPNDPNSPLNPQNPVSPYNPNNPSNPTNPNNPQNNYNAKNGVATAIVKKYINGKYIGGYAQSFNENDMATGDTRTINAPSVHGYKVNGNNNFTITMNANGSLTNGIHTFNYDVDSSQIAPISITYYNQNHQLVNTKTGEITTSKSDATYTISADELAKLGATGDYVNITNLFTAPKGYHFKDQANLVAENGNHLNNIQLITPQAPEAVAGVMPLTLMYNNSSIQPNIPSDNNGGNNNGNNVKPNIPNTPVNPNNNHHNNNSNSNNNNNASASNLAKSTSASASASASNTIKSINNSINNSIASNEANNSSIISSNNSFSNSINSAKKSIASESASLSNKVKSAINSANSLAHSNNINSSDVAKANSAANSIASSASSAVASANRSANNINTNASNSINSAETNQATNNNNRIASLENELNSINNKSANLESRNQGNSNISANNNTKPSNVTTNSSNNSSEVPANTPFTLSSGNALNSGNSNNTTEANDNNGNSNKLPQTNEQSSYTLISAIIAMLLSLGLAGVDLERHHNK